MQQRDHCATCQRGSPLTFRRRKVRTASLATECSPGNSSDFSCISDVRAISGRISVDSHLITAPVGVNLHAVHHLQVRTPHIQLPVVAVFEFNIEPHMWIAPIHLFDCSCQGNCLFRVKLRPQPMMREHRRWHEQRAHTRNQNSSFRQHAIPSR